MDFRNSRFGLRYNGGEYDGRTLKTDITLKTDMDLETYIVEIYEIDELFNMIKAGK
jgi:hypothetical protein